jgi:hypothetical protein
MSNLENTHLTGGIELLREVVDVLRLLVDRVLTVVLVDLEHVARVSRSCSIGR